MKVHINKTNRSNQQEQPDEIDRRSQQVQDKEKVQEATGSTGATINRRLTDDQQVNSRAKERHKYQMQPTSR